MSGDAAEHARLRCVSAREKIGVRKIGVQGAASLVLAGVREGVAGTRQHLAETRALVHELHLMPRTRQAWRR